MNEVKQNRGTVDNSAALARGLNELLLTAREYAKGLQDLIKFSEDDTSVSILIRHAKTNKYYNAFRFMRNGKPYGDGRSVYITSEYGGKLMYNIAVWCKGKCTQYLKYNDSKRCLQVVFDKVAYYLAVDYENARHSVADGKLDEASIMKQKVRLLAKVSPEFSGVAVRRDLAATSLSHDESYTYLKATLSDCALQMGYPIDATGAQAVSYPKVVKTKPTGNGRYCYVSDDQGEPCYVLEYRDQGATIHRFTSRDINAVLSRLFYDVATELAVSFQAKHRVKYRDSRRAINAKLVELMERVSPLFGAYAAGRVDEAVNEYPYDDARFAQADLVEAVRAHARTLPDVLQMDGNLLEIKSANGKLRPYVYLYSRGIEGSYKLDVANTAADGVNYTLSLIKSAGQDTIADCSDADEAIYTIFEQLATVEPSCADLPAYQNLMTELRQNKAVETERLMSGADASEQLDAEQVDEADTAATTETRELSFSEKKQFAQEVRDAQAGLVSLALEAVSTNTNLTDAYVYILTEGNRVSYNVFYIDKQRKIVTLADAQHDKSMRMRLLKFGASDSKCLRAIYVKYGQLVPTETMIHYIKDGGKFDFVCNYKPVIDEARGRTAATSFADWRRNIALHY